ncbi:MAG: serine/threonine protein kinase, partial [Deltaproteobacteria bacterium]|nr:serine/threonine protein kinase [Deltaproteobacteria bacterium]
MLDRALGEGAMAEVWASHDGVARAAIKVLHAGADRGRFEAEMEQLGRLSHPGIPALLDRGEIDGRPWFAMTLFDGPDLSTLAEKLRARPVAERHARARLIADELASTLAYIHQQGIVHRDVKPANVLVGARAMLVDFGVAGPPGQADALVGTPAWAAPEQLCGGRVDARADQYALGLLLYFLLAGRRPFADARARASGTRPRPPSEVDPTVPVDLEAVIQRLLEPRPASRFRSMEEVRAALFAVLPSEAPILAGRQAAADHVAAALDRVSSGEGVVLALRGQVGAGQDWVGTLARASAARRAITCVLADDELSLSRQLARIDDGEALLVVTSLPVEGAEVVELLPLGVGDIRRSVFAAAPRTPSLATVAERVHAWTGGHARLVEACLREGSAEGVLGMEPPPSLDVSPWVDLLDLDTASAAQALAALSEAATAEQVAEVSRVAASEGLSELERLGVAVRAGDRWRLAAECFRGPLLATAPDPETVVERARAVSRPSWAEDPVLARARVAIEGNRHAEAIAALIEAVDADQAPEEVRDERRLLLATLHWFLGDGPGASRAWRAVRDGSRDPRHRARAGVGLGVVALQAGQVDEALDALSAALVDAELAGDLRTASLAG